ncbi:CHAT domain-containing protein [Nocardiopsis sp. JB363]|uniref:CHAT domain-containing protein n=1 Tax=Nocardiopsis sp. JB363 TaxID=1434837 RepID=UPI00097A036D|nr:CHAT domain-containing protein [Nocardiopsis sp. JB363]SIO89784.1 Tetratricopeptide TPR_4 [Nocardiopsis sp. JB363]
MLSPSATPDTTAILIAARPLLARVADGVRLARDGRFEDTVTLLEDTRSRLRGHPAEDLAPVLPGVLTDLGLAQALCGRFGPARDHLHAARDLAESRGLPLLGTVARQNEGCLTLYRGDAPGAIVIFRELVPLVPADRQEALRVDLAEALLSEGQVEEAGRTLAEAPWPEGPTDTARTLLEAKLRLLEGDHRAALGLSRRVRRHVGRGSPWYGLTNRLERLAERTHRVRPLERAREALEVRSPSTTVPVTSPHATRALDALAERLPAPALVGPGSGRAPLPGTWLGAGFGDPHVIQAGLEGALAVGDPAIALEWAELTRPEVTRGTLVTAAGGVSGTGPAVPRPSAPRGSVSEGLFDTLGDRAFVHFARVADQAVALVAVAGRVRTASLGPLLRLRRLLARMRHECEATPVDGATQALDAVDEALVNPVLALTGERPLVVTGAPYLDDPPWGLLPSLRGRPVTVVAGARAWARGRPPRGGRVLLAAATEPAGAGAEVRALSGTYPGARVLERARRDQVLAALTDTDTAHLAGHGHIDERSALLSRVELADGPLLARDLLWAPAPAALVTLATCWGGRGFLTRSPGGFAGTLLALGTHTVVASPLPVSDERTGAAMRLFHRALAGGGDVSEAVADHLGHVGFCCYVG